MKKLKEPYTPDLEEQVDMYISEAQRKSSTADELDDIENYILEAAIEAFYGKDVWDEINKYLVEK